MVRATAVKLGLHADNSNFSTQNEERLSTGLFKMTVGVLTTCHTQYT